MNSHPTEKSRLRAWLELMRIPAVFTAPGDPIVGFLLAGMAQQSLDLWLMIPCASASVLLYVAGMISNDCLDLEEDKRDRPERPIPSGRISLRAGVITSVLLFAAGVGVASFCGWGSASIAGLLVVLILLYNLGGKRIPVLGPLNMGLCRSASLLLGASAVQGYTTPVVLVCAGGLTLYIMAVTIIASKEMSGRAVGKLALLPNVAFLLWLVPVGIMLKAFGELRQIPVWIAIAIAAAWVGRWSYLIEDETEPAKVSQAIGRLLSVLPLIQAAIVMMTGEPGWYIGVVLLHLWPVSTWFGRRFYAS